MNRHVRAKQILEAAVPGIDPAESLLTRGIGELETQYGAGWGHGKSTAGVGSNNWGAIQATDSWTGDTFEHGDSRWDPERGEQVPYTTKFRAYPTPEAGARDLWAMLTGSHHGHAAELARAGRWGDISASLGPEGSYYYGGFGPPEQAVSDHRARFLQVIRDIRAATGEPLPGSAAGGSTAGKSGVGLLLVGTALWVVLRALRRQR